jgi:hypothetical protein
MVGNNLMGFFRSVTFLFFFRLDAVMCMGVTAGAYILTLFAVCFHLWHGSHDFLLDDSKFCFDLGFTGVFILLWPQMKYRQRVLGLILISPLCNAPSWTEWLYNKVSYSCNSSFCDLLSVKLSYSPSYSYMCS